MSSNDPVTSESPPEVQVPASVICPMTTCPAENPHDEEFCIKCGTPLKEELQAVTAPAETQSETAPVPADPLAVEETRLITAVPYPVTLTSHGLTHPGLSGKNNEDAVVVDGAFFPKHNIDIRFLVVVDGMGGEKAGEIAANMAVHDISAGLWFLAPSFEQHLDFGKLDFWRFANSQYARFLTNQIAAANTRVFNYGKAKKLKQGNFGATVVVAVAICDLDIGRVMIHGFVAGDPRCYLILDDKTEQLSEDQTIGGAPSSFLGAHAHLTGKAFSREVWMGEEGIQSLTLLTCSDGFWNMLGPSTYPELANQGDAKSIGKTGLEKSLTVAEPFGRQFDPRVTTGDDNITLGILKLTATRGVS